jgi:hypothetical protein
MSEPTHARSPRARAIAALVLVVVTAIVFVAGTVGYWNRYVALETDAFMDVVEPAVTSEAFRTELSERVAENVIDLVDAEGRLERRLSAVDGYISEQLIEALDPGPLVTAALAALDLPRLADLAGPVGAAVDARIESAIEALVRSEQFEAASLTLIRRAHAGFVAVARDEVDTLESVTVVDGDLRWNVIPLVIEAVEWVIEEAILPEGEELTLPDLSDNPVASEAISRLRDALGVVLPDDFGQVTVMTEAQVDALQSTAAAFSRLLWLMAITFVALVAAAMWVSPHRRRTTIQLALALIVGVVVANLVIGRIVTAVQEGIVDPGTQSTFLVFADLVVSSLRRIWLGTVVVAVVTLAAAWLPGRSGPIVRSLEENGPVSSYVGRHADAAVAIVIAIAVLMLWWVGLGWLVVAAVILWIVAGLAYIQRARRTTETPEPVEEEDATV